MSAKEKDEEGLHVDIPSKDGVGGLTTTVLEIARARKQKPNHDLSTSDDPDETEDREGNDHKASNDTTKAPKALSSRERTALYRQGENCEASGRKEAALASYMACLKNLTTQTDFPQLPQCLHNAANIFSQRNEFAKALQLAQAEKLFYENALIEMNPGSQADMTKENSRVRHRRKGNKQPSTEQSPHQSQISGRATELDHLAEMCLQNGNDCFDEDKKTAKENYLMAMEYATRALTMRQEAFGQESDEAKLNNELVVAIYSAVGKISYAAAMDRHKKNPTDPDVIKAGLLDEGGLSWSTIFGIFLAFSTIVVLLVTLSGYLYCNSGARRCPPMWVIRRDLELFWGAIMDRIT